MMNLAQNKILDIVCAFVYNVMVREDICWVQTTIDNSKFYSVYSFLGYLNYLVGYKIIKEIPNKCPLIGTSIHRKIYDNLGGKMKASVSYGQHSSYNLIDFWGVYLRYSTLNVG